MENYFNKSIHKLETTILELESDADCSIQKIETIIKLIVQNLSDLKEYVLKKGFKNIAEEIHFFKHQKPAIVSKLIFYNTIYKIETKNLMEQNKLRNFLMKN